MSEDYQTHQIVSREPYESCTVDFSETSRGELRVSVKMLQGGPSVDALAVVERAWVAYTEAKSRIEHGTP